MHLLCKIGIHKAAPGARWNAGHCFGRCRRCGRDLIRTPQGKWRVPKGFRVVWKNRAEADAGVEAPPSYRPAAQPVAAKRAPFKAIAPPSEDQPSRELPIQAVLRRLDADFMDDPVETKAVDGGSKQRVQQACTRAVSYDFMDEEAPSVSQRAARSAAEVARDEAEFAERLANANGALG